MIEALPDVDKLSLDDAAAVGRAQSAYNALSDEAEALISKNLKAKLDAAVAKIAQLQKTNQKEFDKIYQETGSSQAALASKAGLTAGTSGGAWVALGLARSGSISNTLAEPYEPAAYQYVRTKGSSTMSDSKSTENSRMILALTSIGKDPSDVAGYDLLEPLADLDYVKSQGINGPIFALIALDSHDYEIPKVVAGKTQTTRDALIDTILAAQLSDGTVLVESLTFKHEIARDTAVFHQIVHAVERTQQRRLAAAGRSNECGDLILLDIQIDIVQGVKITVMQIHIMNFDLIFHVHSPFTSWSAFSLPERKAYSSAGPPAAERLQ